MSVASNRMPAAFVGHGSPMNAIEPSRYADAWKALAASMPRPRAIVCISAHWFTNMPSVTAVEWPRTIHDFRNFPRTLFDVQYPAPGDPQLAYKISELLAPAEVILDTEWGFDHGTWSVLVQMYPDAEIPVVQLSVDGTEPPDVHWDFGQKLAGLRDEGIFVLGSGNVVHNLRECRFEPGMKPYDWNLSFDRYVRDALERRDAKALCDFAARADGRVAVPTPEHYLPLLYPAAMRAADEELTTIVDGYEAGAISMYAFRVG